NREVRTALASLPRPNSQSYDAKAVLRMLRSAIVLISSGAVACAFGPTVPLRSTPGANGRAEAGGDDVGGGGEPLPGGGAEDARVEDGMIVADIDAASIDVGDAADTGGSSAGVDVGVGSDSGSPDVGPADLGVLEVGGADAAPDASGPCGGPGQPCCAATPPCTTAFYFCFNNTSTRCIQPGDKCCPADATHSGPSCGAAHAPPAT